MDGGGLNSSNQMIQLTPTNRQNYHATADTSIGPAKTHDVKFIDIRSEDKDGKITIPPTGAPSEHLPVSIPSNSQNPRLQSAIKDIEGQVQN